MLVFVLASLAYSQKVGSSCVGRDTCGGGQVARDTSLLQDTFKTHLRNRVWSKSQRGRRSRRQTLGTSSVPFERVRKVICPFFGALINEGDLPEQIVYNIVELFDISMRAGVPMDRGQVHIQENFRNIPSGKIDLFNMEGNPNEHITSTGINDCNTFYDNCRQVIGGTWLCDDKTQSCQLPRASRFDTFFNLLDKNKDSKLCQDELKQNVDLVPFNDANPIASGTIEGSYGLLIEAMGQDGCLKDWELRKILLERRYPPHFKVQKVNAQDKNRCWVRLYETVNMKGSSLWFFSDASRLGILGFDNRIASLELAPGCAVRIFEHEHFRGAQRVFQSNVNDLGKFTLRRRTTWWHQMSSFRLFHK